MSIKYAGAAASVLILAALTAGCSSKTETAPSATTSSTSAPASLTIPVSIAKGVVTPGNGVYDATVGEPITLNVDSDVADELHVHSVPEHEFEVKPGAGQIFTFTVTVPGQVVVELHSSDKTVATLNVQ